MLNENYLKTCLHIYNVQLTNIDNSYTKTNIKRAQRKQIFVLSTFIYNLLDYSSDFHDTHQARTYR